MSSPSVELSIRIDTSASQVWRLFVDPLLTEKLGGVYVSDWTAGASIGWKDENGVMRTRGEIQTITPEKELTHTLVLPVIAREDVPTTLHSTISYRLASFAGYTKLNVRETFANPTDAKALQEAELGWKNALGMLKLLAERG